MPLRPPDTRDLVTRRQRALASADSSRYDLTNRVFNAARSLYFGPRAQMPLIYWRSRTPGRELDFGPREATAEAGLKGDFDSPQGLIAYPTGKDPWLHPAPPWKGLPEKVKRQHFIDILLHELAHTQQEDLRARRLGPRHLTIEGGADAFAALARDPVARRMGLGQQAAMPFQAGYGQLGNQYIRRYGDLQALYGQFGQRGRRRVPFLSGTEHGTFGGRPAF